MHTRVGGQMGANPGGWGHSPHILEWMGCGRRVMGSPWNILMSYNVQEYEMRTFQKALGDLSSYQK